MFAVAVGGEHGGLAGHFVVLSQQAIGDQYALKLTEFRFADRLLETAQRQAFDLFIVLLNPTFAYSGTGGAGDRRSDFEILRHLKSVYQKPLVVVHNGYAGYSADAQKFKEPVRTPFLECLFTAMNSLPR